jgi:hypothetical protein
MPYRVQVILAEIHYWLPQHFMANLTKATAAQKCTATVFEHLDDETYLLDGMSLETSPETYQQPRQISGSYSGNVHCAYENEVCACTGVVRYGDPASNTWSATDRHVSGSISCSNSVFGDPKPGASKSCQCRLRKPGFN